MSTPGPGGWVPPRWLVYGLILGLYLSVRGYESRNGDQAYRLPLLLRQQDPSLFADDPFVRAFDVFNPHRGSLAFLGGVSRVMGLSGALLFLWCLTFLLTALGIDRLSRAAWPSAGSRVGVVAIALVLIAHGGNIGTNHLFEPMLLDRLMALALGWVAFAVAVESLETGWWKAALCIGAAGLIHPSIGLQLALLLGSAWVAWGIAAGTRWGLIGRAMIALSFAVAPGVLMNLGQGGRLLEGLPAAEFRLLSVEIQSPQHMLPHLWRWQQWLAWGCYPILAVVSFRSRGDVASRASAESTEHASAEVGMNRSSPHTRLAILLGVNVVGLALAWVAIEWAHALRITLFQPFRMATVARGLALVALAGHVVAQWRRGDVVSRSRAALLTVGLAGDWSLVVATFVELGALTVGSRRLRAFAAPALVGGSLLLAGLWFLAHHDTESGHIPLMVAVAVAVLGTLVGRRSTFVWTGAKFAAAFGIAWLIPSTALVLEVGPASSSLKSQRWARVLIEKCRFAEIPTDDMERLAAWCRSHTPASARFIGPPGPKTFRLWSRRSLAFNRSASPYHAAGLADWSARFRDHVGFHGSSEAFARAYLNDRHGLEHRYEAMTDLERAALAVRNGASFVVAAAPTRSAHASTGGPLQLLHVEGRYAVYSVSTGVQIAKENVARN